MIAVCNVENYQYSTRLLSQTTLRNILGTKTLAEVLTDREHIAQMMQVSSTIIVAQKMQVSSMINIAQMMRVSSMINISQMVQVCSMVNITT